MTMAVDGPYERNTHPIEATSGSNESHWSLLSMDGLGGRFGKGCGHQIGHQSVEYVEVSRWQQVILTCQVYGYMEYYLQRM